MAKRLFIAIPFSDSVVKKLAEYGNSYNSNDINWTEENNLHITAHFLGNVDENLIPIIDQTLNKLISARRRFILNYNKILLAPPGRTPNMLWAVFFPSQEFSALCNLVSSALGNIVNNRDHNQPIPHITLCRFKNGFAANRVRVKQIKLDNILVSKCQLIESNLTPNGPIYKILFEYNLNG